MPKQTMRVEKTRALATFVPSSWNAEARTIDVIVSTGAGVMRYDWWSGERFIEELITSEQAIRMDRLNNGAAVLNTHGQWDLNDQIGVVERGWIEDGKLMATLRLSAREDIAGIVQDIADGIIRNISVGYRVHLFEKVEDATQKIPTRRAADWEPTEVSFVPVPADAGSQSRSAQQPDLYEVNVITRNAPTAAESGPTLEDSMPNRNMTPGGTVETAPTTTEPTRAATVPVGVSTAEEIRTTERQRASEIRTTVRLAKLDESFADDLIARGVPIDEARQAVIAKWAEADNVRTVNGGATTPTVTRAEQDTRRAAMEGALILRANPREQLKPEIIEAARQYRSLSLMEMAREAIEAAGGNTRGLSKMDVAGAALNMTRGAGMSSTSDFPILLANIANKILRRAYEQAPQTFRPLTREVSASDFKPMTRVQLGDAPRLEKVNEAGEFTHGTFGEAKEQYQLDTFGKVVAITRQAIINDDLGAFTRLPELFGRAAADLESAIVWALITANQVMGDGKALFHADHANLGTGAAIDVTPLGEARKLLRTQTGLGGEIINLMPKYLIVPAELETLAQKYLATSQIQYAKSSDFNPFAGSMELIVEPRLDANSLKAWYVAADPGQIDIIEVAYLDGNRGVYLETREGFDVDGVELKARLDFGARVLDHRGVVKNVGP